MKNVRVDLQRAIRLAMLLVEPDTAYRDDRELLAAALLRLAAHCRAVGEELARQLVEGR